MRSFVIGRDVTTGGALVLTVHDGPTCGVGCSCCEFDDGTAPVDHDRDCGLVTQPGADCTCDGADKRAENRKRETHGS